MMPSIRRASLAVLAAAVTASPATAITPSGEPLPALVAARCDTIEDVHASASIVSMETGQPMTFLVGSDPATGDKVLVILAVGVATAFKVRFRNGCAVATWESAL